VTLAELFCNYLYQEHQLKGKIVALKILVYPLSEHAQTFTAVLSGIVICSESLLEAIYLD